MSAEAAVTLVGPDPGGTPLGRLGLNPQRLTIQNLGPVPIWVGVRGIVAARTDGIRLTAGQTYDWTDVETPYAVVETPAPIAVPGLPATPPLPARVAWAAQGT